MRVVVTGGSGYIGKRLICLAMRLGYDVVRASRDQSELNAGSSLFFDLAQNDTLVLPNDTSAVFHLAANTGARKSWNDIDEVAAAQRLIKSAQQVGAKFIFVSSQTARADAPTVYGRTKWCIERKVLEAGGWVVRPGQVYGGELRGLYGTLANVVRKLPILPSFIPSPQIQPIHVDDLAAGLLSISERCEVKPGVYCLSAVEPISFSTFLTEIAKSRLRCKRICVPVPVIVVNLFMALIGEKWQSRLGLDRLRSLFDLPFMATAEDLFQLQLSPRPLSAGLHPSGDDRRRNLLREGRALLAYVLKEKPGSGLLRRYVRAVESLRKGQPLGLPSVFLNSPILISLLDRASWTNAGVAEEFNWRLDATTMLAEASPEGARRFLGVGFEGGLPSSMFSMTLAITGELFWRLLRALFSPVLRFGMARVKGVL